MSKGDKSHNSFAKGPTGNTAETEWGNDEDVPVEFYTLDPAHNHLAWFPTYLCINSPRNTGNAVYGSVQHEEEGVHVKIIEYAKDKHLDVNLLYLAMNSARITATHSGIVLLKDLEKSWKEYKPPEGYVTRKVFNEKAGIPDGMYEKLVLAGMKPVKTIIWFVKQVHLYPIEEATRVEKEYLDRREWQKRERHEASIAHAKHNKEKGLEAIKGRRGEKMSKAMNSSRKLSTIAQEIYADWKKPSYAAKPYLDAMSELEGIKDAYLADSGRSIVMYFLANATTWKGEKARKIKVELKEMLKK